MLKQIEPIMKNHMDILMVGDGDPQWSHEKHHGFFLIITEQV